ncbi:L,D-transpeptidase family protein [Streptomyces sp. N35]|uniref:L,D-transpeptidase family protein n=1 Tax=Streptomyces sp. N35 TaxID=2795730 RepID=UPI001F0198FA|nr:L,D-transpeptidase family protein [Streptomyces sp. N35]
MRALLVLGLVVGELLVGTMTWGALASGRATRSAPALKVPEIEQFPPFERAKRPPFCTGQAGQYQKAMERHLRLKPVDGKQSPADCRAIQAFQKRHGIRHALGYAGRVTWGTASVLEARARPNPRRRCPATPRRGVCVDLTRQLLWVQKKGKVTFKAVPVRTGAPRYRTRTGWFRIYARNKRHRSTLYANAPMPHAQFFSGGQAFHGHYGSIYDPPGSHGCVNMRPADAKALWSHVGYGTSVYIFGRKPR